MKGKRKQRRCRICKKRPPWQHKNYPPGICKRCYHRHVWRERLAAGARKLDISAPYTYDEMFENGFPTQ